MAIAAIATPATHSGIAPPLLPDDAPAWLNHLLQWAQERGATDVHLHPAEGEGCCWLRIDGELREVTRYAPAIHARLIARLKVLGRCADYAGELIMESRFTLNGNVGQPEVSGEARLSIVPTLRGEKAVIRLAPGGLNLRRLETLGYATELISALRSAVDSPQGLVLVTGPSGSGKSTTLYALLADLAERAGHPLSILTVEDPIEQSLPCAAQIAADPARGLSFAAGVRAVLRQDPEVIMIGEIRDAETAAAALQAALTGHRVLSSMHTLSAAEALVRLRQMGTAPFLISSALSGILSTRLVRLACPDCVRRAENDDANMIESFGCESCLGSGHKGRQAIGEWTRPKPSLALQLEQSAPAAQLADHLECAISAADHARSLLKTGKIALSEWRSQTIWQHTGERSGNTHA